MEKRQKYIPASITKARTQFIDSRSTLFAAFSQAISTPAEQHEQQQIITELSGLNTQIAEIVALPKRDRTTQRPHLQSLKERRREVIDKLVRNDPTYIKLESAANFSSVYGTKREATAATAALASYRQQLCEI